MNSPNTPELRRLLSRDWAALPKLTLVDAVAIDEHIAATRPQQRSQAWTTLARVVRRATQRDFRFLICRPAGEQGVDHELAKILSSLGLSTRFCERIESFIPFAASPLTLATASIAERPWHLALLAQAPVVVLDVSDGTVWNRIDAEREYGPLRRLPFMTAATTEEPGERPLVREAKRYAPDIWRHRGWIDGLRQTVPARVVDRIIERAPEIGQRASARFAPEPCDARSAVWLSRETRTATPNDTGYLMVVPQGNSEARLVTIIDGWSTSARLAETSMLRESLSRVPRWVVPRALDALAALSAAGLPIPERVIDPGLAAFAQHPDGRGPLAHELEASLGGGARWVLDTRRETQLPTDVDPGHLLYELRDLESHHEPGFGVGPLVEIDLARTLPVLSQIECSGLEVRLPPGYLSWTQRYEEARNAAQAEAALLSTEIGVDVVRATFRELTAAYRRSEWLPAGHGAWRQSAEDEFGRHVALNSHLAVRIQKVRSMFGSQLPWMLRLASAPVLRGQLVPTTTGRWTFSGVPLHGIPKKDSGEILSAIAAPLDHVFVSADYAAIEPRLLASYSGDPNMLEACAADDPYVWIQRRLGAYGRTVSRDTVKRGLLALLYGQQLNTFAHALHGFALKEAGAIYMAIHALFPAALEFRRSHGELSSQRGYVQTASGWTRRFDTPSAKSRRQAFSTLIQGTAADLLRAALRELSVELPRLGARLVFQQHDSITVCCPAARETEVRAILREVMTARAPADSLALGQFVNLPVKIKAGRTWADV